jgi:hypothetical protein
LVEAGQLSYRLRKRLWNHDYHSDYEWDEAQYGPYPDVLLIAINDRTEQRLLRMIENIFSEFEFYTTTLERLLNAKTNNQAIWQLETENDQMIKLS